MVEERTAPEGAAHRPERAVGQPVALHDVRLDETPRLATGSAEMDRVLGGGLVPGALVLVGGDPGVGKSTLMLQAASHLSQQGPVLYVTAEESVAQTRIRAERLQASSQQLFLMAEGALHAVEEAFRARDWKLVVVDSLQTVYDSSLESAPGSVSQVREVASRVMRLAKASGVPTFLVGHVNKEGSKRPHALGNQAA